MVSSTCTAVAGSLTARRQCPQGDVGEQAEREQRILVEGAFLAGHQPGEDRRVGHLAAVQIGDRGPLLKRVADAGPEHDHGAVGGTQQPAQVELLQDRLAVRPQDRPAPRRQLGSRGRRSWLAVHHR